MPLCEEALIDLARVGLTDGQFALLLTARVELERCLTPAESPGLPPPDLQTALDALHRLEHALTPKAARPH